MTEKERRHVYRAIWEMVARVYESGVIVSESNLQAVLYRSFWDHLPRNIHIVAEPTWTVGTDTRYPDLVLAEDGAITDIFELKFKPHAYPDWQGDIIKLRSYIAGTPRYPVQLDPQTGHWVDRLPVRADCRLHFVAVAQHDAEAVLPLPPPRNTRINHWFGRVGGDEKWGITFV